MTRLQIEQLGPIAKADITLGELTVFVGPQASGKSIALETFKLALDRVQIVRALKSYGYTWKHPDDFLQLYYGEGMGTLWSEQTAVFLENKRLTPPRVSDARGRPMENRVFYIPAHRVLTLYDGWPRPFTDYGIDTPYVLRQFSERIRWLLNSGLGQGQAPIFPQKGRLDAALRKSISHNIFDGAAVRLEQKNWRRRIVLEVADSVLPLMVWSTGQREFVPLLLGLYYLMPSGSRSKKETVDWVVLEEPEMGLHTQGIAALMLGVLELVRRGYRVILSTHASQVLEILWALRFLQEATNGEALFPHLMNLPKGRFAKTLWQSLVTAKLYTYYFQRQAEGTVVKDISTLDPYDEDDAVADWGGLTDFSTHASEVIAQTVLEGAI